jgi:integrase
MSVLSRLLKWGYERGYIPRMLRVPRRKCDNERESFFSEEDEQNQLRLMDQFGYRPEKDLIILLYDTGMRSGEAFKYRGEWYDEETGAIRIPKEINKTKLTRTIWATKRVKEILGRRKKMFGDGLMFPDTSQIRLSTIWGRIRETLGQADNPDYVPYTCRHTCASRMVQRGVRIEVLSRWLGHTNIKMTMRYAKFAPKDFQDAMSVLEAAE